MSKPRAVAGSNRHEVARGFPFVHWRSAAALIGVKAGVGTATILLADKLRTRHRVGAMVLMAALNSVYATGRRTQLLGSMNSRRRRLTDRSIRGSGGRRATTLARRTEAPAARKSTGLPASPRCLGSTIALAPPERSRARGVA